MAKNTKDNLKKTIPTVAAALFRVENKKKEYGLWEHSMKQLNDYYHY
jgi:hypothetical protein